ncbi:hypothetical protein [Alicyclobacillus sp. SO9]|uniref:hypothetical protein n=1 Tax=Alicyclobacillus sp. SO9 TaxID=2665646 RepID=UPI0018E86C84|nr:hypothetical protein [Alicyclobacillus sp. SO9]QQE77127.1 hypothetical protein GI364_14210 [Alicyclobacillus sp. SO9]
MEKTYIDEVIRNSIDKVELSDKKLHHIWNNILTAVASESVEKYTHARRKNVLIRRSAVTAGTLVAVTIGGTLLYKVHMLHSTSFKPSNTDVSTTKTNVPVTSIEKYYQKRLGFQPTLPSYPKGLTVSHSDLLITNNRSSHSASFNFVYSAQASTNKQTQSMGMNISEMLSAQYQKYEQQLNDSSSEKKTIIHRNGLTVAIYRFKPKTVPKQLHPSQPPTNVIITFSKHGIQYSAQYMGSAANQPPADKVIQILEGLTVPEQKKPKEVNVTASGTIANAVQAVHYFKPAIPSFVSRGFKLASVTGETITMDGPPNWKTSSPSSRAKTAGGVTKTVQSTFDLIYKNGQATIDIHEGYTPAADKMIPKGKLHVIKGQRIHLVKEKRPGKTGSLNSYVYQWNDSKSGVFYDVEGWEPSNQKIIGTSTMDKMVSSMLGPSQSAGQ